MKLNSIRWRLPLSYALIALLAAVSLGAVLLLVLRSYYSWQEQVFLQNNAQAISRRVAPFLEEDFPRGTLQSQVEGYAFLSETRVRLLDAAGQPLADSGELPGQEMTVTLSIRVDMGGVSQVFSQQLAKGSPDVNYLSSIVVEDEGLRSKIILDSQVQGGAAPESGLPVVPAHYGLLQVPFAGSIQPRSAQHARWPIYRTLGESLLGYIELSEGPAYGRAIVTRVAWGWGVASILSVVVGAVAGWAVSRQISRPLLDLTTVTRRMVEGDLSPRANVHRQDELGTLAFVFNEMAQRVDETITSLRRFVSDAAHQLQTPLTALQSDLDLIGPHITDTAQLARLERAQSQVVRLETLASGLLELSRVEAKAGGYNPVSLNKIVLESSELYASRAEQADQTYSLDLPEEDITVRGDGLQLRQALENILDNAIKFNRAGGTVRVRLRAEGEWAVLRVEDTGIGIPADDLPHVFGRFHRGRNAADYPGSGLGLAIVKAVVEGHGGTVALESSPQGTGVLLRLPRC